MLLTSLHISNTGMWKNVRHAALLFTVCAYSTNF